MLALQLRDTFPLPPSGLLPPRPRNKQSHTRSDETQFFGAQVELYSMPHTCIPGQYEFPFVFQLPGGLPGSFLFDVSNARGAR